MDKKNESIQLTLKERWEIDVKMAEDGFTWKLISPQCEECKYFIEGNAKNCDKFKLPSQKPLFVLRIKKECPTFEHKEIMIISPSTKREEQLLGGMLGFCVGDALGVPVEFSSREDRKKDPVQEMRAYGVHNQHFGTWSDDTSMSLCLMESLRKGYNIKDIADNFCKFYFDSYWTPHERVFDIGNTIVSAIKRIKSGISPLECGGIQENDNGNGSLMRVLPLAFYLQNMDASAKIKIIEEVSSLTHAHKRSRLACIFYVEMAISLLRHDKHDAYNDTINYIRNYCINEYHGEFSNFCRILNNDISSTNEKNIYSTGYVIDSLEAALWAFMNTNNYSDAIFKAINLGGDTDTIAALTGGLAGIHYGLHSIPNNWIQCLAHRNEIVDLIREFHLTLGNN